MKFMKFAAGAALALAVVGCGQEQSATSDAKDSAAVVAAKVYEPKVMDGAAIALQYRKNTAEALKPIVDAMASCFKAGVSEGLAKSSDEEVAKAKKFYTDSGLEGADVKWALVTVGEGVTIAELESDKVPEVAVAVAFDHDMDKIVAALLATLDENEKKELVETKIGGVKAWKVDNEDVKKDGAEPCFASLDGKLWLGATTPAVLERLVALYTDDKGASAAFATLSSGNDAVVRFFVPALGEFVKKAAAGHESELSAVDMLIPNGSKILLGIGEVDWALLANASGVSLKLSANTAAEGDAESLRTMLNALLTSAVDGLKESTDEEEKLAYSALKDLKLGGEGKAFVATMPIPDELVKKIADEISSVNGLLGGADETGDGE